MPYSEYFCAWLAKLHNGGDPLRKSSQQCRKRKDSIIKGLYNTTLVLLATNTRPILIVLLQTRVIIMFKLIWPESFADKNDRLLSHGLLLKMPDVMTLAAEVIFSTIFHVSSLVNSSFGSGALLLKATIFIFTF